MRPLELTYLQSAERTRKWKNRLVCAPWGSFPSSWKLTFSRALHFCPNISSPALGPVPTPAGHLLAGELVDALDVVAHASIHTVGLGRLVALPGMSRPR